MKVDVQRCWVVCDLPMGLEVGRHNARLRDYVFRELVAMVLALMVAAPAKILLLQAELGRTLNLSRATRTALATLAVGTMPHGGSARAETCTTVAGAAASGTLAAGRQEPGTTGNHSCTAKVTNMAEAPKMG